MEFDEKKLILSKQFVRFLISGGVAAIFGMLTIYVLTNFFKVWYLFSSTVSFLVTFIVAFALQKFWSFQNRQWHLIPKQAVLSFVLAVFNFLINMVLMYVFVNDLRFHYFFSQLLVYGFFAIFDFFVYKFIIFRR